MPTPYPSPARSVLEARGGLGAVHARAVVVAVPRLGRVVPAQRSAAELAVRAVVAHVRAQPRAARDGILHCVDRGHRISRTAATPLWIPPSAFRGTFMSAALSRSRGLRSRG